MLVGAPVLKTASFFGSKFLPSLGKTGWLQLFYRTKAKHQYVILLGTKRANLPFLGGTLYVDPATIVVNISGTLAGDSFLGLALVDIQIPIPNDTSLCGRIGVFQAGILDSRAKGGVSLSNGLEWKVGK